MPLPFSTILVVEDDEDVGEMLAEAFRQARPYLVLHMTDGAHALEAVRAIQPNVLLVDYQLPGIDGLELYDRLHACAGFEDVPALLMSANAPPSEELHTRAIRFIAKPFELAERFTAVDALLSKERPQNQGELPRSLESV